jgi:hypothetical protein
MEQNPFAVLSLIVAPAILTNASSILIMSTSNRLIRAADRARELSKQLENTTDAGCPDADRRLAELAASEDRTLLLLRALRSFYVAVGAFALAAFVSLLGAMFAPFQLRTIVLPLELAGVCAGLTAVAALVSGAALLIRETRIAVHVITERANRVRQRFPVQAAAEALATAPVP